MNDEEFYKYFTSRDEIDHALEYVGVELLPKIIMACTPLVKREYRLNEQGDEKIKEVFRDIIVGSTDKTFEFVHKNLEDGLKSSFEKFDRIQKERKNTGWEFTG